MRFLASDLATACGGRLEGPDVVVDGATIDSRAVVGGELFVPIVAERDGHDFVMAAVEAGANAYLTGRPPVGGTPVVVSDTGAALTALGRAARDRLPDRVVGVTGSVGKTSVKDLLAAALRRSFETAANLRSFNNELGVPLTLLNAPDGCEAAVVEMGARFPGNVAELCAVARPTVGVVTAVSAVHTETFGDVDGVALAKGELVEALPADGTAVLNAADERVLAMARRTSALVVTFGVGVGDVRAEDVQLDGGLRGRFTLVSQWGRAAVSLAVRGQHQVGNAVAAGAAALACGAGLEAVAAGLGDAVLSPWRMQLEQAPSGALVLNDAYNANPVSTEAALRSLAALDARRRIAFLGTMAELGPLHDAEHRRITVLAADLGLRLVAVAEPAYGAAEAVADLAAAAALAADLGDGDAVLVKASRVAGLERLAALLLEA